MLSYLCYVYLIIASASCMFCANNKFKCFPSVLQSRINIALNKDKIMYYIYIYIVRFNKRLVETVS
jgi:hypothetical protein